MKHIGLFRVTVAITHFLFSSLSGRNGGFLGREGSKVALTNPSVPRPVWRPAYPLVSASVIPSKLAVSLIARLGYGAKVSKSVVRFVTVDVVNFIGILIVGHNPDEPVRPYGNVVYHARPISRWIGLREGPFSGESFVPNGGCSFLRISSRPEELGAAMFPRQNSGFRAVIKQGTSKLLCHYGSRFHTMNYNK
jgi:hypothetical protein